MENFPAGRGPRTGVPQVHRMLSLPGRPSCSSRTRQERTIRRAAFLRSNRRTRNAGRRGSVRLADAYRLPPFVGMNADLLIFSSCLVSVQTDRVLVKGTVF